MKHPIRLLRPGRATRVVNALTDWNEPLTADVLHQKYCKMASSAFVFYRGTAHLFWSDFAHDWHALRFGGRRTRTWLQGDAHAENMGAFNDQKGQLRYGLNDFDESITADYQLDLWRFAVSLVLVMRGNGGFSGTAKAHVINALSRSYLDTMASYARKNVALKRIFTARNTRGLLGDFVKKTEKSKNRKKMVRKWTKKDGGKRRLDLKLDDLAAASKFERADIEAAMPAYRKTMAGRRKFTVRDVARRLSAGTGSLGTPRYYVLVESREDASYHLLDVKRQSRPSAYDYLSEEERVDYDRLYRNNHARRQAYAYEALARRPDAYLGWIKLHNGFYSVRERSPFKKTFPTDTLKTKKAAVEMARVWAEILATDHTRAVRGLVVDRKPYAIAREITRRTTGGRARPDFLALVRDVAFEYANQVQADHGYFVDAVQPDDCKDFV